LTSEAEVTGSLKRTEVRDGGVKSKTTSDANVGRHDVSLKRVMHKLEAACAHLVVPITTSDQDTTLPSTKSAERLSTVRAMVIVHAFGVPTHVGVGGVT
jgi:hypothetical protein